MIILINNYQKRLQPRCNIEYKGWCILFILDVGILAINGISSASLEGLLIGSRNKSVKISQYVDDGILYINNEDEICCALNILSDFRRAACVILNISLTTHHLVFHRKLALHAYVLCRSGC